ncbi:MAG: DLW-39 family protein [Dermatophilaceae bacterium]
MRARLLVTLGAAVAAAVAAAVRSASAQRAERDLWAEATDDVSGGTRAAQDRVADTPRH